MARRAASIKQSSGEGFNFEDYVAASFMAQMLIGHLLFGPEFGTISQIDFQVRDKGWLLDDLLLTLKLGAKTSHCALSVKSNQQMTSKGFPASFVSAIWEQWKNPEFAAIFDPSRDMLCLVTAPVALDLRADWENLLRQALLTDADRLISRMAEHQMSAGQRTLFGSLHCPHEICAGSSSEIETAKLLRAVRLISKDFEHNPSDDEALAISFCRSALVDESTTAAIDLWEALCGIANEGRPGGSYSIERVLSLLKGKFKLKSHPDFRSDWKTLSTISAESIGKIKPVIGTNVGIDRSLEQQELRQALLETNIVMAFGESGCGKSALLRQLCSSEFFEQVIWLDPEHLDQPGPSAVSKQLGLTWTIEELMRSSASTNGSLVFDSLENFSQKELDRTAEIIKAALSVTQSRWNVLIAAQSHARQRILNDLVRRGIPLNNYKAIDIGSPKPSEILEAIGSSVPGLHHLLFRPRLANILCNLKVLDWIFANHSSREGMSWVGESDVVEWVWKELMGNTSMKHSKAAFLMRLADQYGESLPAKVSIQNLRNEETQALDSLEQQQLLRVSSNRISFSHDLLGDWARLQVLLGSDNVMLVIRQKAELPRWQAAIRLYAQRLLETSDDSGAWAKAISQLQGGHQNEKLASDYFLDAIIFAANSESYLESVWPDLIANRGKLLNRFINRFLHTATVPDTRFVLFVNVADVEWLAANFRLPYFVYWRGVLRAFEKHADDIIQLALYPAAEVCNLWLRTIPSALGSRLEAARLTIKLSREAQVQAAIYNWDFPQNIFEALLYAAPDLPDEVSQIVLELCRRRDVAREVTERVAEHNAQQQKEFLERVRTDAAFARRAMERQRRGVPVSIDSRGPLSQPARDGPTRRVPDGVQLAILATPALTSLEKVLPIVAREALLAACIDEPSRTHSGPLPDSECGTTTWRGSYPPMYFRGPFLQFLQIDPDSGLDSIVRLVNYATEKWLESLMSRAPGDLDPVYYSLDFALGADNSRWFGNFDVYHWHRSGPQCVASALMALEKWFYDELAAGRSIEVWIDRIIAEARSVAFAGLLSTVAVMHTQLINGPFRKLLSSWRLIEMQAALARQEETLLLTSFGGWAREVKMMRDKALEWHQMPHRKRQLRYAAMTIFSKDQDFRNFLHPIRANWTRDLAATPNDERLEVLVASFDPSNYHVDDHAPSDAPVRFALPQALREKAAANVSSARETIEAHTFPQKCRSLLRQKKALTDEEAELFWRDFQEKINFNAIEISETLEAKSITGGIAVMFALCTNFLRIHTQHEAWCLDRLLLTPLPEPRPDAVPFSVDETAAEAFRGEAAFSLLARAPSVDVRRIAAESLAAYLYHSTSLVMKRAFIHRHVLREDFDRALNFLLYWSAVRGLRNYSRIPREDPRFLDRLSKRLIQAFTHERLPTQLTSPHRLNEVARRTLRKLNAPYVSPWEKQLDESRATLGQKDKVYRPDLVLDTEVIRNGFSFLVTLNQVDGVYDRGKLLRCYSLVLSIFVSSMPKLIDENVGVHGTPSEFDLWVSETIACLIPQLSESDQPKSFWQPFIDLGPGARYWLELFLQQWFFFGLTKGATVFTKNWSQMAEYAFDAPLWSRTQRLGGFNAEACSLALMGMGRNLHAIAGDVFIPIVSSMKPQYKRWAERWLNSSRSASQFCSLLSQPSGRALLPDGIDWIANAARTYGDYEWRNDDLPNAISGALHACWRNFKDKLFEDQNLKTAFSQLLNTLCAQLNSQALNLKQEFSEYQP